MPAPMRRTNPIPMLGSGDNTDIARMVRYCYEALAYYHRICHDRGISIRLPTLQISDHQFDPSEHVTITREEKL